MNVRTVGQRVARLRSSRRMSAARSRGMSTLGECGNKAATEVNGVSLHCISPLYVYLSTVDYMYMSMILQCFVFVSYMCGIIHN